MFVLLRSGLSSHCAKGLQNGSFSTSCHRFFDCAKHLRLHGNNTLRCYGYGSLRFHSSSQLQTSIRSFWRTLEQRYCILKPSGLRKNFSSVSHLKYLFIFPFSAPIFASSNYSKYSCPLQRYSSSIVMVIYIRVPHSMTRYDLRCVLNHLRLRL